MGNFLPRANTPEEIGLSSKVIESFLRSCDLAGLNMHSFMVLRSGVVGAECYWRPFKKELTHTMFSFSKAITAFAVGFAREEGLMTLEDKVCDYFPYTCKNKKEQELYDSLTVMHLITHQSGKKISIANNAEKNEWLHTWQNAPFGIEPGKKFEYLSENIYMLGRIVSKATGEGVLEYLKPRLFDPLDIDLPVWETDHNGYVAGGWGLYLTTEDMAKIGQCLVRYGEYGGKQVVPREWVELSSTRHIDKIPSVLTEDTGYGFQMFIQRAERESFSLNGLYGQFAVMFPKFDACFICTAGEPQEDVFMKILLEHFPAAFIEPVAGEQQDKAAINSMREYIAACESRKPEPGDRMPETEKRIDARMFKFKTKPNASILGVGNLYILSSRAGGIDEFLFNFSEDKVTLSFKEKNSPMNTVDAPFNGEYGYNTIQLSYLELNTASYATWLDEKTLKVVITPLEMAQRREYIFTFSGDKVSVKASAQPGLAELFSFYMMFNGKKITKPFSAIIKVFSKVAAVVLDPNFKGEME